MTEEAPGVFSASLTANLPGIYRFRIVAEGGTLSGTLFTREQLATAAVWSAGDQPSQPPGGTGTDEWCRLIQCLLSEKNLGRELEERLRKQGVDLDGIRRCLKDSCQDRGRNAMR
jgi:hypothetical protein